MGLGLTEGGGGIAADSAACLAPATAAAAFKGDPATTASASRAAGIFGDPVSAIFPRRAAAGCILSVAGAAASGADAACGGAATTGDSSLARFKGSCAAACLMTVAAAPFWFAAGAVTPVGCVCRSAARLDMDGGTCFDAGALAADTADVTAVAWDLFRLPAGGVGTEADGSAGADCG